MFDEFLEELKEKKITIFFLKGKLQYNGPEKYIDEEFIARLTEYKPKLLKMFWPKECLNILPINTEGNLTPFFLIHGGSFFGLSDHLGNNRPFYSFFHIGSEVENIRFNSVESFASEYLRQLQLVLPNGPCLLGGMSIGGNLAFEMAIHLQQQGHEVPRLILVDSGLPEYDSPVYYKHPIKRFYYRIYKWLTKVYIWFVRNYNRFKNEILKSIVSKLSVNKRIAHVALNYDQLVGKYKPVTEFQGEILLFRASDSSLNSEYLGWDKVCKNITVVHFIGDHRSMFYDDNTIELIKRHIGEWLKK